MLGLKYKIAIIQTYSVIFGVYGAVSCYNLWQKKIDTLGRKYKLSHGKLFEQFQDEDEII